MSRQSSFLPVASGRDCLSRLALPPESIKLSAMHVHPDKTRRSPFIRFAQSIVRWFFRISMLPFLLRVEGMRRYPTTGAVLVCSNHQSNLDPMILGCVCPRPLNYLAKKQLFDFKPLGWFLRWNDGIELDRDGGLAGIKETLKRLKKGESIIVFPEGTRSIDGELQPLKRGFCTLARRTKAAVLPVGIAGARNALPRKSLVPVIGAKIQVVLGEAIEADEYADLSDEELTLLLEQRIKECFEKARKIKG